jgi:hypothetical protein
MKSPIIAKQKELNVCGWQAVSTLFARHPAEVRRLFFDAATGKRESGKKGSCHEHWCVCSRAKMNVSVNGG